MWTRPRDLVAVVAMFYVLPRVWRVLLTFGVHTSDAHVCYPLTYGITTCPFQTDVHIDTPTKIFYDEVYKQHDNSLPNPSANIEPLNQSAKVVMFILGILVWQWIPPHAIRMIINTGSSGTKTPMGTLCLDLERWKRKHVHVSGNYWRRKTKREKENGKETEAPRTSRNEPS